ncbi:DUF4271 domain-containing protein [Pedobacter yulinensis]|uniref:DUF4271 domain-containing protein n=1 Tax=Pedobacter yulinensis TaxID=2126353 RepID=A0A2T3HNT3_9SPHI|nr:DUF4271 domain-containing protein [Pedobacter yulinensis]PST84089.1 DUF4271 domain-containing protein [Pedobacter yulinensis]
MLKHLFAFAFMICCFSAAAQVAPVADSLQRVSRWRPLRDSAYLEKQRRFTDSSIYQVWLHRPGTPLPNQTLDRLEKEYLYPKFDLAGWFAKYGHLKKKESRVREGKPLAKGKVWVLGVIFMLLLLFAILKFSFFRQLQTIVLSFFSNRVLSNLNKEENLFTSWPFLLLFIQFGFTIGMFFYLASTYYGVSSPWREFEFYAGISVVIILLYALKILVLRFLGFLFNIQKPVGEYVSILYLSYFNASLVFMPLVLAFALMPLRYGQFFIVLAGIMTGVIFTFQLIRAGINILSHNKFSKVYLFLYFCALEICPILILIKTIGL